MLDDIDKKIIVAIQGDLPISTTPFLKVSKQIGILEDEFLDRLKILKEKGYLRRIGAILRHNVAGYKANALVVWKVPNDEVENIGKKLAEFKEISHCYERECFEGWNYNLYTMIHARDKDELASVIENIKREEISYDYIILNTISELKKTSVKYFV